MLSLNLFLYSLLQTAFSARTNEIECQRNVQRHTYCRPSSYRDRTFRGRTQRYALLYSWYPRGIVEVISRDTAGTSSNDPTWQKRQIVSAKGKL